MYHNIAFGPNKSYFNELNWQAMFYEKNYAIHVFNKCNFIVAILQE
jgi:hypothetical protein